MMIRKKELFDRARMIVDCKWEASYQGYKKAREVAETTGGDTSASLCKATTACAAWSVARMIINELEKGNIDALENMYANECKRLDEIMSK